jgi:chromosome segregation ATPase
MSLCTPPVYSCTTLRPFENAVPALFKGVFALEVLRFPFYTLLVYALISLASCKQETGSATAGLKSELDAAMVRLDALEQKKGDLQSSMEAFKASLASAPAPAQSAAGFTELQTAIEGMLGKWSRVQEEVDAVRAAIQDAGARIGAAKSEEEIQQARSALEEALRLLDVNDQNIKTYEDALRQMNTTLSGLSS